MTPGKRNKSPVKPSGTNTRIYPDHSGEFNPITRSEEVQEEDEDYSSDESIGQSGTLNSTGGFVSFDSDRINDNLSFLDIIKNEFYVFCADTRLFFSGSSYFGFLKQTITWALFVFVISVLISFFSGIFGQSSPPRPTPYSSFRSDVMSQVSGKEIQLHLLSAAKSLEERVPPTMLFASDKSKRDVVGKLADTVISLFGAHYNLAPVTFVVKESDDLVQTSYALREAIENARGERAVVWITGIEKMTGWTPISLQELTDKDLAPFKKVVFLLTVEDDSFGALENRKCDKAVASVLKERWLSAGLTEDRIGGVVTRIIGRVLCVS